ncbi:Mitochodrial transcription termination factor-related [Macleaya cordata]|uniref:Mitochodrial transcription termination factor-related n=1 Tax=Macleaya cordata TaxID=56857 RepID=A0A200PTE8_MACCD|nr:Mitochodrial transcription termination factor-related [Macleaya cordata]
MFRVSCRDLRYRITNIEPIIIHFNLYNFVFQNQNPLFKFLSQIPESTNPNPPSFTVDYLINSCGLPPKTALSVANKIRLCSTEKPDSVISLFQNHGFTTTQITKLISKRPSLLLSDPYKTLKPKIDFFYGLGIFGQDLSEFVALNPSCLAGSLHNQLIPSFNFLKTYLGTNSDILMTFKRCPKVLHHGLEKVLIPNISILRNHGVPNCNISKLLISHPRVLTLKPDRLKEIVESVKKMGFDSSRPMFARAVRTIAGMSKSTLERKLAVYREFGFSEDDILSVFKKQPLCMNISEQKIRRGLEFFMEKLKWKPVLISVLPSLLTLSLEKRIIPWCGVLEILYSKGTIGKKLNLGTVLMLSQRDFLEKFVIKYQEAVPEVMKAYKGEIKLARFVEVVGGKEYSLHPS